MPSSEAQPPIVSSDVLPQRQLVDPAADQVFMALHPCSSTRQMGEYLAERRADWQDIVVGAVGWRFGRWRDRIERAGRVIEWLLYDLPGAPAPADIAVAREQTTGARWLAIVPDSPLAHGRFETIVHDNFWAAGLGEHLRQGRLRREHYQESIVSAMASLVRQLPVFRQLQAYEGTVGREDIPLQAMQEPAVSDQPDNRSLLRLEGIYPKGTKQFYLPADFANGTFSYVTSPRDGYLFPATLSAVLLQSVVFRVLQRSGDQTYQQILESEADKSARGLYTTLCRGIDRQAVAQLDHPRSRGFLTWLRQLHPPDTIVQK